MITELLTAFTLYQGVRFVIEKNKPIKKEIIPGAEGFKKIKGKTGILLLHGFTSSPWDHQDLGKFLADKGITVFAPLTAGHGTSPEHLAITTHVDWINSVDKAYQELRAITDTQIIAGDSLGGNLALILASRYKPNGVITMGTPIFFKKERIMKTLLVIAIIFKSYQKKWYHNPIPKEIRNKRITYDKIPLMCMKYTKKVVDMSKKSLKHITCPILIMQSTTDFGVGEESVSFIYKHVNSKRKIIRWIKDAYHVFIIDRNKKESFQEIYSFVKDCEETKKAET